MAEVVDRLYTFTVYVYHGWKPLGAPSSDTLTYNCWSQTGATTYIWEDQMKQPALVERFEFNIFAPGAR